MAELATAKIPGETGMFFFKVTISRDFQPPRNLNQNQNSWLILHIIDHWLSFRFDLSVVKPIVPYHHFCFKLTQTFGCL